MNTITIKLHEPPAPKWDRTLFQIPNLTWFISDEWKLPMLKVKDQVIAFHTFNGNGQVNHEYTDQHFVFHNYREVNVEIIGTVQVQCA